ncbi:MAG TPA: phosphatidylserine decarboxylase [Thermoplasmata archaeon]|nr:phosphatidylserine decarboxylase [Thermoplasmata archaeon]
MFAPGEGGRIVVLGAVLLGVALLGVAFGDALSPVVFGLLIVGAGIWVFTAWFYRDPERSVGEGIVSPADGKIAHVDEEGGRLRIAVFMNVTDVHVNRFPLDAHVLAVSQGGEGFRPAYRPEASHNVRREYRLQTAIGEVLLVQITGILARRLVSFVRPEDERRKGERLGMIVMGSRVELYLPADRAEPVVRVGERVRAGSTPIARIRS